MWRNVMRGKVELVGGRTCVGGGWHSVGVMGMRGKEVV